MADDVRIAYIPGDGIGIDVAEAAMHVARQALSLADAGDLSLDRIHAGAAYFAEEGRDIETDGEERARKADAIFLGAIGLPAIRHPDGTEISPHLRLRELFQLYAGVRPVKAYPNGPQKLADPKAADIDLVILRESTEGLFYSAAVHNRSEVIGDSEVRDTLRITRTTTEKLHRFAFNLATRRKARGHEGKVTCVDKANVFPSMAFFRKIYDEIRPEFPDIEAGYNYVDAQALDLVRKPWEADVLVMENMFGDILSDLAGGLVGGMGMASCGEIGDENGLFQPAHGSAPDIMGKDLANPLASILSGSLMLDYLGEKLQRPELATSAQLIDQAVQIGFEQNLLNPAEFGGPMGTKAITNAVSQLISDPNARERAEEVLD
ncbi:MAG: isocitrate/isopropylmalate family dehydrogenase [Pseudomonadota bacterium]